MNILVNGETYRVEFRHVNLASARGSAKLHHTTGINGYTTCVIVTPTVIAVGTAICSSKERFSREIGRRQAMQDAFKMCKPIRAHANEILDQYAKRTATPAPRKPAIVQDVFAASQAVNPSPLEAGNAV